MNIPQKQLEEFIKNRQNLIKKLDNKELSKIDFIEENYGLIQKLNMKPLLDISSIEEGIYNYQYYNILAKVFKQRAIYSSGKKKEKKYNENIQKSNNYYDQKDIQLKKLLEFVNFNEVESYYIKMHSKRLNKNIFEIVLKNVEMAIFHSMNQDILEILKKNNAFTDEIKDSKISEYINSNL